MSFPFSLCITIKSNNSWHFCEDNSAKWSLLLCWLWSQTKTRSRNRNQKMNLHRLDYLPKKRNNNSFQNWRPDTALETGLLVFCLALTRRIQHEGCFETSSAQPWEVLKFLTLPERRGPPTMKRARTKTMWRGPGKPALSALTVASPAYHSHINEPRWDQQNCPGNQQNEKP